MLVVGCGSIGRRHLRNLRSLGVDRLLGVDPLADRRDLVGAEFGATTFATLEDAWAASPSIVFVTSPSALHVEVAVEAARRGCHLFIEKPVSHVNDAALSELADEVRERRLVSLVGCNLRFHPGLRKLKGVLGAGLLGRVVSARAQFGQYLPDWHPWEDYRRGYSARRDLGGGIVLDAIHEFDYLRWLFGEVDMVAGFAGHLSHIEIDTEDTASAVLRFRNGTLGELHVDYVQRTYSRSCEVVGDRGTAIWDFRAREVRVYLAETGAWTTEKLPETWDANEMYVDELRHFFACVAGQEQPEQDIDDARRVLALALAVLESSRTNAMVRLSP